MRRHTVFSNVYAILQLYGTWGYPGENKFGDDFDKMQEKLTERYKKFACMTSKPSR